MKPPKYYQPVEEEQPCLLDMSDWKREWQDMPEFIQEEMAPFAVVMVRFRCLEDLKEFCSLIGQDIRQGKEAQSIWYPKRDKSVRTHLDTSKVYADES